MQLKGERPGLALANRTPGPSIRLAPGENAAGLLIQLTPASTISGRVVNAEPVGASVTLMEAQTNSWVARNSSITGEFRLEGIPAGEYNLFAQALGPEKIESG